MGYLETAVTQKQETGLLLLRPALQFVQNLTGKSENPLILIGDFFREGDLTRAEELHDEVSVCVVHLLKLILAYTFSNFETAAREAEDMEPILFASFLHPGFSSILTYYSVALVTVAGNHHGYARKRLVAKARKSLKMLKSFSKYVPESCLDKIYFVEAELAAVTGNYMSARDKYMITIALSAQFGDLMLRSIACERVAAFLRDRADESGANHYFREAHSAYTSWGAIAKVEQLEKDMPELFCTPNE
jgi:predicted ATPase